MEDEKKNISSASAELRSDVYVTDTSPHGVPSCGIIMTEEQAIELATCILAVARAKNAKGLITITGYPSKRVTIIREKRPRKHRLASTQS